MRDRVTIQRRTTARNSFGEEVATWADIETRWAEVKPVRATEKLRAGQVEAKTTHIVKMRYGSTVRPQDRIVAKGETLEVIGVVNVNNRNRELEVDCVTAG
ncbi:MAG: phage head closure protein [Planctomycetes bacterium]|nr:phage head closure protein [Planctomycetota bacterium]